MYTYRKLLMNGFYLLLAIVILRTVLYEPCKATSEIIIIQVAQATYENDEPCKATSEIIIIQVAQAIYENEM
jgi:hypothetical protein